MRVKPRYRQRPRMVRLPESREARSLTSWRRSERPPKPVINFKSSIFSMPGMVSMTAPARSQGSPSVPSWRVEKTSTRAVIWTGPLKAGRSSSRRMMRPPSSPKMEPVSYLALSPKWIGMGVEDPDHGRVLCAQHGSVGEEKERGQQAEERAGGTGTGIISGHQHVRGYSGDLNRLVFFIIKLKKFTNLFHHSQEIIVDLELPGGTRVN